MEVAAIEALCEPGMEEEEEKKMEEEEEEKVERRTSNQPFCGCCHTQLVENVSLYFRCCSGRECH